MHANSVGPVRRAKSTSLYRHTATGVQQEVGSVGGCRRLVGDRPVTQGHAHDGRHVSLGAEDVDGDPSGFPCGRVGWDHYDAITVSLT